MDMTSATGLGAQVRTARLGAGMTQQDLARASGVSRLTIGLIERGHPNGEVGKLLAVARALGMGWRLEPLAPAAFSLDSLEQDTDPL
ncbi:helix-turn-helix transcriptional regulator [Oerskovia turbata]|nr:helix-turn-helix domain-containing protein [Oerskovia turbata]